MDIIYEPLTAGTGEGSMSLPLRVRGAEDGDYGIVHLPLAVRGKAGNDETVDVAFALPLQVRGVEFNDGYGLVRLPPLRVLGAASTLAPSIGVGSIHLPLTVWSYATSGGTGTGSMSLPLRVFGAESDAVGRVRLPALRVRAQEEAPSRFATLYQLPSVQSYGRDVWVMDDWLRLGDEAAAQWVMVRTALLALGGGSSTLLDGLAAVTETLAFADVAGVVWNLIYAEQLALGDAAGLSTGVLMQMADALALSAGCGSALDALDVVAAALALGEAAHYTWPVTVLEQIALAGGGALGLLGLNRQTEQLALSDTAVGVASFVMLAPETLELGDVADTTAELINQIIEGLELLVRISLPDGEYLAWVCNTASRAFTSYRNFPFNSFCELDGHYYGATDEGIYLLEGDDDAGMPIEARIRGGLMDMGTGRMKRQEAMYLGYRADGQLLLKVVTTNDAGAKTESWYSLAPQPAQTMREGRIKIGRGLKSVYWGFEVANIDGADFELDSLSWLPMVLDRRI